MSHTTYALTVQYAQGQVLAKWNLVGNRDPVPIQAQPGDKIAFTFSGPGDIVECVLISGQVHSGSASSPFTEGNRINLKAHSTLTVGTGLGLWGFAVAFSARNSDGTTSFYFLPDPELQVGST